VIEFPVISRFAFIFSGILLPLFFGVSLDNSALSKKGALWVSLVVKIGGILWANSSWLAATG